LFTYRAYFYRFDVSLNKEALYDRERDFKKAEMPFGVFIGADKDKPDDYVITAINAVAGMFGPDKDGNANDYVVIAEVSKWKDGGWLAMPMDPDKWENEQLPKLCGDLDYDIIIPDWWMKTIKAGPDTRVKGD